MTPGNHESGADRDHLRSAAKKDKPLVAEATTRVVGDLHETSEVLVTARELDRFLSKLSRINACMLCGSARVFVRGVFQPDEPWRFSAKLPAAGKVRTYYYGLCEACFSLPDCDARRDCLFAKNDGGSS